MADLRLSDEQARELWRRAAELQASAERSNQRVLAPDSSGLSLEQVALAAEGAGIDPDYVRVALAEKQLPDAECIDRDLWSARWFRKIVRVPDAIELLRTINASPTNVLAALRTVSAKPSFDLVLESTLGQDPLRDGVLVYRLANDATSFQDGMNWSDARVFLFTIRPEEGGTRVSLRVPLFRRGINLALTGGSAAVVGSAGMSLGATASGALPAIIAGTTALALAPVAIGGLAGIALGVTIYRRLYGWTYKGGVGSATQLLEAIAMEAETTSGL